MRKLTVCLLLLLAGTFAGAQLRAPREAVRAVVSVQTGALSGSQLGTLKTDIAANANKIGEVAIKDLPNDSDAAASIAAWYNTAASPAYLVWRSNVTRKEVYTTLPSENTSWSWGVYKGQSAVEQDTWKEIFMGGAANFGALNNRAGCFEIFKGTAPNNNQRAHILSVARRAARVGEKVYSIAVASTGGITASVDNGNTLADARGATSNPDALVVEGQTSAQQVSDIRAGL